MQLKIEESLKPVIELLNNRYERMKLKERKFRTADVASETEMESVFDEVKTIDTSLQQGFLQKKGLLRAKDYQNFMQAHSHTSHYAFQLQVHIGHLCLLHFPSSSHAIREIQLSLLPTSSNS